MKRTFPANISGKIYYIDEDAYTLLKNYFTQLRESFPKEEGVEIVCDIEARVAEIFDDRISGGSNVITLQDVNSVIERMGSPEDLSGETGFHGAADGSEATEASDEPLISINLPRKKRLYRDLRDKVFGGVVSGLANYLGWSCNVMRLLLVVLALCSYVWPWVVVYLVAWMIIPPADTSRRILEMLGRPVTVDSVGRTVLGDSATPPPFDGDYPVRVSDGNGFWRFVSKCFSVFGKCLMILLLVAACAVGVTAVVFLICAVAALVLGACYHNFELAAGLGLSTIPLKFNYQVWAMILSALTAFIPCVGLVWAACCVLFNKRGASTLVIVAALVLEVLLIAGLVILFNLINAQTFCCIFAPAFAAAMPVA